MSKRFDYYAGYPGQQGMPKWVGVTLGGVFGGIALLAIVIAVRMLWPAGVAQASLPVVAAAHAAAPSAPLLADATPARSDAMAPSVLGADDDRPPARVGKHRGKHRDRGGRYGKKAGRVALAAAKPSKGGGKYKHAQVFAKQVSGSRRDKRARDDLDRMLGL